MSIATEITRLQGAKSNIKSSIEAKGVSVPSNETLDNYSGYIDQISGGGGGDQYINEYFYIKNLDQSNNCTLKLNFTGTWGSNNTYVDYVKKGTQNAIHLWYSFDKITWTFSGARATSGTSITFPSISPGSSLYLKGDNTNLGASSATYPHWRFSSTTNIEAGGNLKSLLIGISPGWQYSDIKKSYSGNSGTSYTAQVGSGSTSYYLQDNYRLAGLFENCTTLKNIDNLRFYSGGTWREFGSMFEGCTGLTEVHLNNNPLVIDYSDSQNYVFFFRGCTNLTKVWLPLVMFDHIINKSELDLNFLYQGFQNCTSLTEVWLPAFSRRSTAVFPTCFLSSNINTTGTLHLPITPTAYEGVNVFCVNGAGSGSYTIPSNWAVSHDIDISTYQTL